MDTPPHRFSIEAASTVHEWGVWKLVNAEVRAPSGEQFQRTFVHSPGAVAAVPITERGEVILVWQYRTPIDGMLLEIPAGMRDVENEELLLTAQRELAEEAGYQANHWQALGKCMSSAGLTDSLVHIFLARELTEVDTNRHGPEEQHMSVVRMPLDDAVSLVELGEISDAKTAVGLLLAARLLGAR